ncbi:MAG: acyl-CoA thioesterase YciA [Chitinophagales bacterium]|jgi:acyl-CoA thioesterase YciA
MSNNPHGNLAIRTLAMPADANPSGDIFGGWVLSQMDIAASTCAVERAQCRTVTVALDAMSFISPVKIGDVLSVYTKLKKVGNTSMEIYVEAWAKRGRLGEMDKVTEAMFKFVAVDEDGKPTPVLPL